MRCSFATITPNQVNTFDLYYREEDVKGLKPSIALFMSSASIITTCSGYSSFLLLPSFFFLPSIGGSFTDSSFFFFAASFSPSGLGLELG